MTRRPPHEPTRPFAVADRFCDDASAYSLSLGCVGCPDFNECGGLHTGSDIFDCDDLCTCADREKCDMVCRRKPVEFYRRNMEVGGFSLANIPRAPTLPASPLPDNVPLIDHKYGRNSILKENTIALPLYALFHMGKGEILVRDRSELSKKFLIPANATIVATGVARDAKVEGWWGLADRSAIIQGLRALGIAVVTTPNYSLFTDVPRPDNLHAMKRIGLSWVELVQNGVPAALHLNSRTEQDYGRWTSFLQEREEVSAVSFEFGTGAGRPGRIDFHVKQLCKLADEVDRPLILILRGGARYLRQLRLHFHQVVFVDSEGFSRTLKRRRATIDERGRLRWQRIHTAQGEPLDELLAHNVEQVRRARVRLPQGVSMKARSSAAFSRRPTYDSNTGAVQLSFMSQLDSPSQRWTVSPNGKRMITAPKT